MGYSIDNVCKNDIENIMQLVAEQGWEGYNREDIEFIVNVSGEDTCFKLTVNDEMSGMILSLFEDDIAYISFFLIRKNYRNIKYALMLAKRCLNHLEDNSKLIVIYANPKAAFAYKKHKFKELFDVRRFEVVNTTRTDSTDCYVETGSVKDIDRCISLNRKCYKTDRKIITKELFNLKGAGLYLYRKDDEDKGYAFIRINKYKCIIGPLVALEDEVAVELISKIKEDYPDNRIIVEAPEEKFKVFLETHHINYKKLGVFVKKMYLGDESLLENDEYLYTIGGHHFS